MKTKFINMYMKIAEVVSESSYAKRLQVGAIAVKDDKIISIGYNGTEPGAANTCEDHVLIEGIWATRTKPSVIHAEANLITKLAQSNESSKDASIFITHAPCLQCAKLIAGSGFSSVYYRNSYSTNEGLKYLESRQVNILKV